MVEDSAEAHSHLVQDLFHRFLHRDAEPAAVNFFVDAMGRGLREEFLIAAIVSSDEFQAQIQSRFPASSPNQSFAMALFQLVLNRPGSANEISTVAGLLPANATAQQRFQVALLFVLSDEFREDFAFANFSNFLHRRGDDNSAHALAASGNDLTSIRESFEASQEFEENG
jgi:hypothetical protein